MAQRSVPWLGGEDRPGAGHAFELVFASRLEGQARSGGEVDTVRDTRISFGPARSAIRLAVCTAMPGGRSSISPVCSPARSVIFCAAAALRSSVARSGVTLGLLGVQEDAYGRACCPVSWDGGDEVGEQYCADGHQSDGCDGDVCYRYDMKAVGEQVPE